MLGRIGREAEGRREGAVKGYAHQKIKKRNKAVYGRLGGGVYRASHKNISKKKREENASPLRQTRQINQTQREKRLKFVESGAPTAGTISTDINTAEGPVQTKKFKPRRILGREKQHQSTAKKMNHKKKARLVLFHSIGPHGRSMGEKRQSVKRRW